MDSDPPPIVVAGYTSALQSHGGDTPEPWQYQSVQLQVETKQEDLKWYIRAEVFVVINANTWLILQR
jgi:hypothetical protein